MVKQYKCRSKVSSRFNNPVGFNGTNNPTYTDLKSVNSFTDIYQISSSVTVVLRATFIVPIPQLSEDYKGSMDQMLEVLTVV